MQQPPAELDITAAARVLQEGWTIPDPPTYWPVGFGSHHWRAGSWVLTAEKGAGAALEVALGAAAAVGAPVAVPPVPAVDGSLVQRAAGWTFVLHAFVEGTCHGFGHVLDRTQTLGVVALLADLHGRPVSANHEDSELVLDIPAGAGPYRERVDGWLSSRGGRLRRALADDAGVAAGIDHSRDVLTHGEPHPGNLLQTTAGWRLLDWDTARLAPPERGLWRLVDDVPSARAGYERRAGRRLRPEVLAHYRRRWDLADVVASIAALCADHREGDDAALSWKILTATEL